MVSFDAKYSLEPGHVFEGKYRILRELGSGGFGVVYLAQQLSMDRPVALKILKPGVGAHAPSARERFLREVKIISKLRHPNTVTIHDYGETIHGVVYMVLEYVEGETLKELLEREGAQDPFRTLSVARQIARSLAEAHTYGVVHRDLKPANIMLTELEADTVFVKVLDFGVARLRDGEVDDLTSAGVPEGERALIGTPRYMSPEQVRGEGLSGSSDVYGLGLIMYEMLIGTPAVQGDTTMGLISQQISPEPLRLPSLHALPHHIQELIRAATHKSLQRRIPSADDLAKAIDETVLNLGDSIPDTNRAAYFSVSGRFPAVARPTGHQSSPVTPSGTRRTSTSPGSADSGPRRHMQAMAPAALAGAAGASLSHSSSPDGSGWYEATFEPDDLVNDAVAIHPVDTANALQHAPTAPLMSNQQFSLDEDPLLNILDDDLPPPPSSAASPFAEPEPTPPPANTGPRDLHEEDDGVGAFAFVVIKLCVLATLAVFFTYITFLVIAALVGEFTDGFVRMAIGASIALAIPLFTTLGEFTRRERFEVVQKASDRWGRILLGITIFSAASVFLASVAMSGMITYHLRNDPNWMFQPAAGVIYDPTPTTELNRKVSLTIADFIEKGTAAIGRYTGEPTDAQGDDEEVDERPVIAPPPPEPTRPGTRSTAPPSTRPGTAQPAEDTEAADERDGDEAASPPPTRTSPPPTRPGTRQRTEATEETDGDSEYVPW